MRLGHEESVNMSHASITALVILDENTNCHWCVYHKGETVLGNRFAMLTGVFTNSLGQAVHSLRDQPMLTTSTQSQVQLLFRGILPPNFPTSAVLTVSIGMSDK